MTTLSVTADIPAGTDLLGKSVTDLQSNIVIGEKKITGELKYVDDFTGFSGDPAEQEGNYLALFCECAAADSITAEVIGGDNGPTTLDSDGLIIFRIKNNAQSVRITAIKDGYESFAKTYSLSKIQLDSDD